MYNRLVTPWSDAHACLCLCTFHYLLHIVTVTIMVIIGLISPRLAFHFLTIEYASTFLTYHWHIMAFFIMVRMLLAPCACVT